MVGIVTAGVRAVPIPVPAARNPRLKPMEEPQALERMDCGGARAAVPPGAVSSFSRRGARTRLRRLDEILPALAEEAAEEGAPPVPGVWRTEVEKLRADLRGWLSGRDPQWSAAFVELGFGLTGSRRARSGEPD